MTIKKKREVKILGKELKLPDQNLKPGYTETVYFPVSSYDPEREGPRPVRDMYDLNVITDDLVSLEYRMSSIERVSGIKQKPAELFAEDEINANWKLYGMEDFFGDKVKIKWTPGKERK